MYSVGLAHCKLEPYFYLTLLQFTSDILKSKPITIIMFGFYARLVLQESFIFFYRGQKCQILAKKCSDLLQTKIEQERPPFCEIRLT